MFDKQQASSFIKSVSMILLIFTLVKRFFNNQMGNTVFIEISDVLLISIYVGMVFYWSKNQDVKEDRFIDNIKVFLLAFTLYFILTIVSQLFFNRHILIGLPFIGLILLVIILYLIGRFYGKTK